VGASGGAARVARTVHRNKLAQVAMEYVSRCTKAPASPFREVFVFVFVEHAAAPAAWVLLAFLKQS
jgi:hypothetical protein